MGLLKNLLGIASEEDWPDMTNYNAYFTDTLAFYYLLEKDYSGKLPRGLLAFLAIVLSFCFNNTPDRTMRDMSMSDFDRMVILMYKTSQIGSKLCNDPIEEVAMMSALMFCKWNLKSLVVAEQLQNMSRGAYAEFKRLYSTQDGVDEYREAYVKNDFTDMAKIGTISQVVEERCKHYGIL